MNEELESKVGASIGIVIILLVLLTGAVWVGVQKFSRSAPPLSPVEETFIRYSTSSPFALSFLYPNSLFLEEKQVKDAAGVHTQIVLVENSEENRLLREGKTSPREGPIAITIDVLDNTSALMPIEKWILQDSRSNYALATSDLSTTTIAGFTGFSYSATGLYESDNIAVSVGSHILFLTVTYMTKDDFLRWMFIDTVLPTLTVNLQQ